MSSPRYLYLTRHAEAPDESELSSAGRRQAELLGGRLRDVPLSTIHHGPLPRAAQTARIVADQLDGVPLRESGVAGDYVPYVPERFELPPDSADRLLGFLAGYTADDRTAGVELARRAAELFTGPVEDAEPRHELVVTHAFLVGWLVRAALDSPPWRWIGINHANAALTVIRYAPGRPSAVLVFNDMSHLPADLRWTGFPAELRV